MFEAQRSLLALVAIAAAAVGLPSCTGSAVQRTLPAGTVLRVEMLETVSSGTHQPGDPVVAQVVDPVELDGVVVIPAGSQVEGTVTDVVRRKKIGGKPKLAVEFTSLNPAAGEPLAIRAHHYVEGRSDTKKDAATIGGAAAGGALLGRVLEHDHEADATAVGALAGAAIGTGIAASRKGGEAVLPAGAGLALRLESPVALTVRAGARPDAAG